MKYPTYVLRVVFFALASYTSCAYADLPLTVEDLLTDKGKVKLDLSVAYTNSDRALRLPSQSLFKPARPLSSAFLR